MSNTNMLFLALMGIAFIIWVFLMIRMLFGLKRIADARRQAKAQGYFAGLGTTISVFAGFLTAPEHRKERNRVLLATVAMFATIFLQMFMLR